MGVRVKLSTITDAMEIQSEQTSTYLDKRTGEVVLLTSDDLRYADEEHLPEWLKPEQLEDIELARKVVESDDYVSLPSKFDIHEWEIMRDFCCSLEDERLADDLLDAIHGSGAFRLFKREIRRRGIEDNWYKFRDAAFRKIAIAWCEDNGIEYEE